MPSHEKCAICGPVNTPHLHCVKEEWAAKLSRLSGVSVKINDRVCCRHFKSHDCARFGKQKFPGLIEEMATPKHTKLTPRKTGTWKRRRDEIGSAPTEESLVKKYDKNVYSRSRYSHWSKKQILKRLVTLELAIIGRGEEEPKTSRPRIDSNSRSPQILDENELAVSADEIESNEDTISRELAIEQPRIEFQVPDFNIRIELPPVNTFEFNRWCGMRDFGSLLQAVSSFSTGPKRSDSIPLDKLLALFLVWARMGFSFPNLAAGQGISPFGLSKAIRSLCKNELYRFALSQVNMPDIDELVEEHPDDLLDEYGNRLFFFVDGTIIPVHSSRFVLKRKMSFNSKHQTYSTSFWILVSPLGRIHYLSKVDFGNVHDATAWNESNICEVLRENYPAEMRGDYTLAIGGDKAYPNIDVPPGFELYITKSGEDAHGSKKPWVKFSPTIAKYRSVVERSIGQIKSWRILSSKPYMSRIPWAFMRKLLLIICALCNFNRNL